MKYNLLLVNSVFNDEKSKKEIKFSRLSLDLGYKKAKLTTDPSDICSILDITERQLKTQYPFDGEERVVGVLSVGELKETK
jgi:hypothetical protein